MTVAESHQSSFSSPLERSREVIKRCAQQFDPDHLTITVSGGTDSVVAADIMARLGPEYGLTPDSITHINTGTGIPQSRLTARLLAELHDLEWIEQGYRNEQDALAHRVLDNGWPASYQGSPSTGGHGLEWANRKDKPMDEVYVLIDGQQLWVSGVRKLESKKRQGNVPDSGVERDRARRVWLSPICGWTDEEKREYIRSRRLPVSESYDELGFSGECTACAYDGGGLITSIDLLCPELAYALRSLAVWLYQRVLRGDVELEPKRLCWGWDVDTEDPDHEQTTLDDEEPVSKSMVGCDENSCATGESASWVRDLPDWQIVRRDDVLMWWNGRIEDVCDRFRHIGGQQRPPEAGDTSAARLADGGGSREQ